MRRMFRYFIFSLFIFFAFNFSIRAESCDTKDIVRLKDLAKNVDVTYEYLNFAENPEDGVESEKYTIIISGITDYLYIEDDYDKVYTIEEAKDGIIKFETFNVNFVFKIYSEDCDRILRTINLNLPTYNSYSDSEECEKLKSYNLDVCDPLYNGPITAEIFNNAVNQYLEEDKSSSEQVFNFVKQNYIWILFGILLTGIFIVFLVIRHRRRSVLE